MSDIPVDHKCFNYIFNNGGANYWFDIVDGIFGYWYEDSYSPLKWNPWNISLEQLEDSYNDVEYLRATPRQVLVGPMQPPPSPIIKKIREMEKRRQVAYA